ncbi:MAG: galactose mutarotase [Bacilli bacterium]|nr:galactose mutarotase [Bacilli bacterium]
MKKLLGRIALISFALVASACGTAGSSAEASSMKPSVSSDTSISSVEKSSSSSTSSKTYSSNYQLSTASGLKVYFKEQGARIDKIEYNGKQIAKDGFIVGRVANRIANGKFTLNGTQYSVTLNDRPNSLHGGGNSWQGPFATANWKTEEQTASSVKYKIVSADKDNGYPGEMTMYVTYTLTEEGELSIEYSATTTKDTLCNPTNHLFIDINGSKDRNYANTKLQVNADYYTPLQNQIPTGAVNPVSGTQFDYKAEKAFDGAKSYDDNYVLNHITNGDTIKAATLTGTQLGVKVDVYTDRPGMQLYKDGSGNICLETQMLPDAINHPEFDQYGTTILRAGETFSSKTTYHFSKVGA